MLEKDVLKEVIKEAMAEFLKSPEGEQMVGTIVLKALNIKLDREVEFEDGSSEPGRIVIKKELVNVIDWLVKYIPRIEGAIRGCQKDSAQARNRATETGAIVDSFIQAMAKLVTGQIQNQRIGVQVENGTLLFKKE